MHRNIAIALLFILNSSVCYGAGPNDKNFGFGVTLGDPMGGTMKYWTDTQSAFNFAVGGSQFGKPRIGADFLWHFDAFGVDVFRLYAGPGVVIGVGNGTGKTDDDRQFYDLKQSEIGMATRAIIGVALIPRDIPFELFLEMGPLVGLAPKVGSSFDFGIGFRFYP